MDKTLTAHEQTPPLFDLLRTELVLQPGHFVRILRITICTVMVVLIAEIFRIPEVAYSAYIVFFISKKESKNTIITGISVVLAVTVSIAIALAIYAISAGEPGLRLPLMGVIIFCGMFAARISPLGPVGFAIGFLTTLSLTIVDIIPPVAPKPSGEILSEAVLWLWVIALLPCTVVVLENIVMSGLSSKAQEDKLDRHALLVPDAFTNPAYINYALKTTLAILIAYATYNLLAWPEIRTCMITCFFVALGTVDETIHKMTLRMAGAFIGGCLGFGAVIFVMPHATSIIELCLLIATGSFFAAWIATSSERISYAGLQIALAFFLCTLVEFGPTTELALARDRVVGVFLGNLIVSLVFILTERFAIFPISPRVVAVRSERGTA